MPLQGKVFYLIKTHDDKPDLLPPSMNPFTP